MDCETLIITESKNHKVQWDLEISAIPGPTELWHYAHRASYNLGNFRIKETLVSCDFSHLSFRVLVIWRFMRDLLLGESGSDNNFVNFMTKSKWNKWLIVLSISVLIIVVLLYYIINKLYPTVFDRSIFSHIPIMSEKWTRLPFSIFILFTHVMFRIINEI